MVYELIPISILVSLIIFVFSSIFIVKEIDKKKVLGTKNQELKIQKIIKDKENYLNSISGMISFKVYLLIGVITPIIIGILFNYLLHNQMVALIAAIISIYTPELVVKLIKQKQDSLFEDRMSRALRQLSSNLRAGMSIQQAVEETATCEFLHPTILKYFKQINADMKIGVSVKDAFMNFAKAADNKDAYDVAYAIALQCDVGGNEAKVVENIAKNISDRIILKKEIKSLFAETNMTVKALDFLPFIIIIFLYCTAPQYLQPFFQSPQMKLIFFGLLSLCFIGSFVIRVIVRKSRQKI